MHKQGAFLKSLEEKSGVFSCFAKVASLGGSEVADPVSANSPSALFRAALLGGQHSFCVKHARPGMAGSFDGNPGICNPVSHLRSDLVTPKMFIPASTGPQSMAVATCYM